MTAEHSAFSGIVPASQPWVMNGTVAEWRDISLHLDELDNVGAHNMANVIWECVEGLSKHKVHHLRFTPNWGAFILELGRKHSVGIFREHNTDRLATKARASEL